MLTEVGAIGDRKAGHIIRPSMSSHPIGCEMIRLVGPGGAGKSTIGALLAQRLNMAFHDLDRHLADRVGDLSEFIDRNGYDHYARENVETYYGLFGGETRGVVIALSSGFMTYADSIHPEYARVRREIAHHPTTFVLLPSLQREACVAETVRRQIARPFGRSPAMEESVIRARFEIYSAVPAPKIETRRPVAAVVDEIVDRLWRTRGQSEQVRSD